MSPGSSSDVGSTPEALHNAFKRVMYVFLDGELISVEAKVCP